MNDAAPAQPLRAPPYAAKPEQHNVPGWVSFESALTAEQATQYRKPAGAGCVVSSLRGYFRSRLAGRLDNLVHGLIGALALPGELGAGVTAVSQFLSACTVRVDP